MLLWQWITYIHTYIHFYTGGPGSGSPVLVKHKLLANPASGLVSPVAVVVACRAEYDINISRSI